MNIVFESEKTGRKLVVAEEDSHLIALIKRGMLKAGMGQHADAIADLERVLIRRQVLTTRLVS